MATRGSPSTSSANSCGAISHRSWFRSYRAEAALRGSRCHAAGQGAGHHHHSRCAADRDEALALIREYHEQWLREGAPMEEPAVGPSQSAPAERVVTRIRRSARSPVRAERRSTVSRSEEQLAARGDAGGGRFRRLLEARHGGRAAAVRSSMTPRGAAREIQIDPRPTAPTTTGTCSFPA